MRNHCSRGTIKSYQPSSKYELDRNFAINPVNCPPAFRPGKVPSTPSRLKHKNGRLQLLEICVFKSSWEYLEIFGFSLVTSVWKTLKYPSELQKFLPDIPGKKKNETSLIIVTSWLKAGNGDTLWVLKMTGLPRGCLLH